MNNRTYWVLYFTGINILILCCLFHFNFMHDYILYGCLIGFGVSFIMYLIMFFRLNFLIEKINNPIFDKYKAGTMFSAGLVLDKFEDTIMTPELKQSMLDLKITIINMAISFGVAGITFVFLAL